MTGEMAVSFSFSLSDLWLKGASDGTIKTLYNDADGAELQQHEPEEIIIMTGDKLTDEELMVIALAAKEPNTKRVRIVPVADKDNKAG